MDRGLSPRRQTYAGLFTIALATLMLEIVITRIFSVTMWYHFSFMAISIAMFGMAGGAIFVYLLPDQFPPQRVHRHLAASALLFSATTVLCLLALLRLRPIFGAIRDGYYLLLTSRLGRSRKGPCPERRGLSFRGVLTM
jgi:hypothetical protein